MKFLVLAPFGLIQLALLFVGISLFNAEDLVRGTVVLTLTLFYTWVGIRIQEKIEVKK